MRSLFTLLAGFLIALVLFMLSPMVRELGNKARQRLYFWQLQLLARTQGAAMAAPANSSVRSTGLPYSDVNELITQHNNLVASLRGIATKLDADATVTDVNYFLLWCDSANALSPKQITAQ